MYLRIYALKRKFDIGSWVNKNLMCFSQIMKLIHVLAQCRQNPIQYIGYWVLGLTCIMCYQLGVHECCYLGNWVLGVRSEFFIYIIYTIKHIHVHVHTNDFTKNSALGVKFNICYAFYISKIHIHIHVLAESTQNPSQDIGYWVLGSTCIISYFICVNVDMYPCSYTTIKEIGYWVSCM